MPGILITAAHSNMLTIHLMVRVGPWTLVSVSRDPDGSNCERCNAHIKEIWTCRVDPTAEELLATLGGQLEWRVGSKCGPTLLEVSEAAWKKQTGPFTRRMNLLVKLEKLLARASAAGVELPDSLREGRPLLLEGSPTEKQIRHLGLVVGGWTKRIPHPE